MSAPAPAPAPAEEAGAEAESAHAPADVVVAASASVSGAAVADESAAAVRAGTPPPPRLESSFEVSRAASAGDDQYLVDSGFADADEEFHMRRPDRTSLGQARQYWKTILAAVLLAVVGVSFITSAVVMFILAVRRRDPSKYFARGFAYLVVGLLCSIPGAYQCYVLYKAFRRVPGYSFATIPSYSVL